MSIHTTRKHDALGERLEAFNTMRPRGRVNSGCVIRVDRSQLSP
jgi:hypothetical protein